MQELVQFAEKFAKAVEDIEKAGPENYSTLLLKTIPGLVSERLSDLARFKKEIAQMDEAKKAAFVNELKEGILSIVPNAILGELIWDIVSLSIGPEKTSEEILDTTLFVFGLMSRTSDYLINYFYSNSEPKKPLEMHNPPKDFWFLRVDGEGTHEFHKNGHYLINSIPKVTAGSNGQAPHYNAEIYNSPYTTLDPKNVTINTFPVDPPVQEQSNYIYDFFLNTPYAPTNEIEFAATIKAEGLKGGSRGWGFWNTALGGGDNFAWFIQIDGYSDPELNGVWAQCRNASGEIWPPSFNHKLHHLDVTIEHLYGIRITEDCVEFFIDNQSVCKATDPKQLPNKPMAFHNWVDNTLYFGGPPYFEYIATEHPRKNITKSMAIKYGETTEFHGSPAPAEPGQDRS